MQLSIYQVDAFAEAAFQGNPAAVVPLEAWLPDVVLQQIAQENNLAETAYFVPSGEGYHLRWFTPTTEVRLCGHATLASAHVLFGHLGFAASEIRFQTLSGTLRVWKSGSSLQMDFPADGPGVSDLSAAFFTENLGISVLDARRGKDDYLVRISSASDLETLQPDLGFIRKLHGARGLIVTAPGDGTDIASRCFYPATGVDEDAVTGSAHTLLAPYWASLLGKKTLSARQGGNRRGFLTCSVNGDRVELSGKAVTYLSGTIYFSNAL